MFNEKYFAGIDVGTSYIKTVVLNQKKEIIGYTLYYPLFPPFLGSAPKGTYGNVILLM